jgi:hypothetical protein
MKTVDLLVADRVGDCSTAMGRQGQRPGAVDFEHRVGSYILLVVASSVPFHRVQSAQLTILSPLSLCLVSGVVAGDSNRASPERSQEEDSFHSLLLLLLLLLFDSSRRDLFRAWNLDHTAGSLVLDGAEDEIVNRNSRLCGCQRVAVDSFAVRAMELFERSRQKERDLMRISRRLRCLEILSIVIRSI